jgi:hypothetical protein
MRIRVIKGQNTMFADRQEPQFLFEYEGETPRYGDYLYLDGKLVGGCIGTVRRILIDGKEERVEVEV